jgi:hypothetical protein
MARYFDVRGITHKFGGFNIIEHVPCDEDESGDPKYYGLISHLGTWVIIQHNETNGTFRYAVGKTAYTTNWTGRAGLTYGYFNDVV